MKQTAPTQSWSSSTLTVTAIKHMSGLTGPLVVRGAGATEVALFPLSPFNPCVRFSRTRLTDGLLVGVTQSSDNR